MTELTITRQDSTFIVQINRPHRRNAINRATADALGEAWRAFDADESLRVGILTGGDEVFCAGADLKEFEGLDMHQADGPLGCARMMLRKPVIAAIAGYAVAGGLELACWCDLRIADESAVLGCFERRFGVPLVDGGTQRLPHIVGLGRALELILTGRPVSVQEALSMGLVNEIVPRGQHLTRALALAQQLAAFPQACMTNDRLAVYEGLNVSLFEGLKIEAQYGQRTLESGEAVRGAQSFADGAGRSGEFKS
jgi:enoyl-CoA hydratase